LVVSTASGLWRYVLGDVVECTGRVGTAPRVRFLEREGHVLTLMHDRTSEHHLRAAVRSMRDRGVRVLRFCLGPSGAPGRPPRYALAIACDGAPPPAAAEWFDAALREANYSYNYDRREGAIGPLELHVVPVERFRALELASAAQAGAQAKAVELSRSPDFLRALGIP
ncbi:MAG TPA: GH3 auxin-responsive promoter family protein, partial [Myxococcales bacterium]|nr:GH3 auxin-responsive promoter family protein [Myxococcales bacterium]